MRSLFSHQPTSSAQAADRQWAWWPLVPLYPYNQRQTLRFEVIPDQIWVFEQLQGIFYVVVPIRMTVVRLQPAGLLVYAPVAPTPECVRLLRELEAKHGEVRYIIAPTASGLEHKVFVGPFARQFKSATVYTTAHQWSFPLNLPNQWLGMPMGRTQILPSDPANAPFGDQFDYAILGPVPLGLGQFEEAVFCHRTSKTLLVTDVVISMPATPPEIVQAEPYPLLFHARDNTTEPIEDTPSNRIKGWQRTTLFANYFRPASLNIQKFPAMLKASQHAVDRSKAAYFGLYPFAWQSDWQESFTSLHAGGALRVAPILQTLVLNRGRNAVRQWLQQIQSWDFTSIVPCHFSAPIQADPI
ncbi:MAG: DUF4336 domain-containing protein, partial [Cyanobacteria bacterium P01_H01_bin.121]